MPPARQRGFGLKETLRDHKRETDHLLVYPVDGDQPARVAFPNVRNRIARALKAIDELAWSKVELLDKKGQILAVHKRGADDEAQAGELEDIGESTIATGRAGEVSSLLSVSMHWSLKAQEVTMNRFATMFAGVLDAQARLVDSTIRRFEQLDAQSHKLQQANFALSGSLVEQRLQALKEQIKSAGLDESESGKLLDDLLPVFLQKMLEGKPSKPNGATNGAAKKGAGA